MVTLAALCLAAALAQPAPAPASAPDGGADAEAEPLVHEAPAGSPADQRLWRDLLAATNGATLGMGRLSQCSFRIRYGRYYERLDAVVKDGTAAEKEEAAALRERLAAEAKAADAAVPAKPGVRACKYVLRDLGLFMPIASEPRAKKQLPVVRGRATACVAKLAPLSERLRERATRLEAALAAVDASAARPAAAAAAPPAAPGRAPAAAETPASPAAREATP